MDQHFIPAFYLRAFRDQKVPEGQESWLWVADLQQGTVQRRAPKNVGKKADYYAFPEAEAAGGEALEAILSKVESGAAPAMRRLLASETAALDGQDRADILLFMALFVVRVPSFRNAVEQFEEDTGRTMMKVAASNPEYFARTVRKAMKDTEDLTPKRIEKIRQWVLDDSRYTVHASPAHSIVTGFTSAMNDLYPIFEKMTWAVVRSGGVLRFLTSDTPVSWVDPTIGPPFNQGLLARNVEVSFPISPFACLLGTWEGRTDCLRANVRAVERFNARRVGFADHYIFADSEAGIRRALELRHQMEQARP